MPPETFIFISYYNIIYLLYIAEQALTKTYYWGTYKCDTCSITLFGPLFYYYEQELFTT
jgi:hypothetical protein